MLYTVQLIEPIRLEIGKMLISHEIVKLFPNLCSYDQIKDEVNEHWTNFNNEVIIRDFWNLVDSLMMGYKLKEIVRDITSQRHSWNLEELQVNNVIFSSNINGLESNSKTASEIKEFLNQNPLERKRIIDGTKASFPETDKRYLDPIIILSQEGKLFVHDGNGRLLKAIVEDWKFIKTYIGVSTLSKKPNYWIPTSLLMRLADSGCEIILIDLIQKSDNALFEFKQRVFVDEEFKKRILSKLSAL